MVDGGYCCGARSASTTGWHKPLCTSTSVVSVVHFLVAVVLGKFGKNARSHHPTRVQHVHYHTHRRGFSMRFVRASDRSTSGTRKI
eukprot:scaffold4068_cov83-Skeletonema_dohrnii-CCMP3373.AAC.2